MNAAALKIVGSRTDGLVMAFRVRLCPLFLAAIKKREEVARRHGRAAFRYEVKVPEGEDGAALRAMPRLGPFRARWTGQFFDDYKYEGKLWGELQKSTQRGVFHINNPCEQIHVKEHGDGADSDRRSDCNKCRGMGSVPVEGDDDCAILAPHLVRRDRCDKCLGAGTVGDPGWTIEVVTRATELARVGLERAWRESEAIAALCGEVLESRLRRLDLCADVAGWQVSAEDLHLLAKRPQARIAVNDNGERPDAETDRAWIPELKCGPACKPRCVCSAGVLHEVGGMNKRRVTGLSIGRTGNFMARIYDKRAELELDRTSDGVKKRCDEEDRWRAREWDGEEPVTRVEFQMRGVVLSELGVRDPDACLEPVAKFEPYTDRQGKGRVRRVVMGHRVLTTQTSSGEEVQATIVDRLDAIWRTCLEWIRLVVPRLSRSGKPVCVSRLADDPRWALLRTVRFAHQVAAPITRYRPRKSASWAQALGVMLSQAGRDGILRSDLPEDRAAGGYEEDDQTRSRLRARVFGLCVITAKTIVEGMIEKFGGVAAAMEHFAIRHNAARARFERGRELVLYARPPPQEEEETLAANVA